jgi:hypothetical protein
MVCCIFDVESFHHSYRSMAVLLCTKTTSRPVSVLLPTVAVLVRFPSIVLLLALLLSLLLRRTKI